MHAQFWWICELLYIIASSVLKVAIGTFLLRVTTKKVHIFIIRVIIAGTCVFGTLYFFVAFLQCRPFADFWRINPGAPTCISHDIITGCTYAASVLVSLSDWTYGILPIFIVWDLNMTKRNKLLVAGILAFAAIGSTATVVRIPYIHTLRQSDDFLCKFFTGCVVHAFFSQY
jgi:hypothetical protein